MKEPVKDARAIARVDAETKRKADHIYRSLGTTTSRAINMFLTATVREGGFPFPVSGLSLPEDKKPEKK